jgi:iron complex transport system ATP-binding protein
VDALDGPTTYVVRVVDQEFLLPSPAEMALVPALELRDIEFVRDGRRILHEVSLVIHPGERWLVIGANGSGKTSLVRIAAMYEHPTRGSVSVLGETLGTTDVRTLRRRIGYVSASFASEVRPALTPRDIVMTAKYAALEPWWHQYDDTDRLRAAECLEQLDVGGLADRTFGTLSSGEQQRVLLARSLMNAPAVVLLDEPSARLDLGGREQLVESLERMVSDSSIPAIALVTHHLDEVPPSMTHCLLLKSGRVSASGMISDVLDAPTLSECFGLNLMIERRPDGRYSARAAR